MYCVAEEALVTTCTSDQPESDQHLSFPLIQVQGPEPGDEEVRAAAAAADSEVQLLLTSCQLSQASLESDGFYSDLVFSETPSPVQGATRQTDTDWR